MFLMSEGLRVVADGLVEIAIICVAVVLIVAIQSRRRIEVWLHRPPEDEKDKDSE
jgi:hypothetical protein